MKIINLFPHQVVPVQSTIDRLLSGEKVVLSGCPGSGKTIMSIYIIKELIESGKVKNVLVLTHSTNVILKNFKEEFDEYNFPFSNQVTISLPNSTPKSKVGEYDLVVIDEAHENYLADRVQGICKNIPMHLLLTGTPSKLIYKGGFGIEVIAMADIPRSYFAKTGVELVVSKYNWDDSKYTRSGNVKSSFSFGKGNTFDAVDSILNRLVFRLTNKWLTPEEYNKTNISGWLKKFFPNRMNKTLFACASITQAELVNKRLLEKGFDSRVSHSENDIDSLLFKSFKDGEFDVLVVVNRGRLGYSDNDLYNIIDMTGTRNPDLIYQMFARCVRGTQEQQKMYIKLSGSGPGMMELTDITTRMALSLMFEDIISTFNGKNFKGMFIPTINKSRDNSKTGIKRSKKEEVNKVKYPQYTNDVVAQLVDVRHSIDSDLEVYKMGNVGGIISDISGSQKPSGYWTFDLCKEISKKYKSRVEWSNSEDSASFRASQKNGWLDSFIEVSKFPKGYWTKERCSDISKNYENSIDWRKNDPKSYRVANKKGWVSELVTMMKFPKGYWTKERCKNSFLKYKNIPEWKKNDPKAYRASIKKGYKF